MADTNFDVDKLKAGDSGSEDSPKKTGGVGWMEISKVVAMPLVTLIVGSIFSYSINSRQEADQNSRLYADMMSRREESDSALRKDMFQSILATFLKREERQPHAQDLEQEVLNIELLAYNFHESLDLGPLFKHVQRDLTQAKDRSDENLLWRVEKVAKEVKAQQLAVLADSGRVDRADLDVDAMSAKFETYTVEPMPGKKRGGPTLCMSINSASGETHWRQFSLRFLDFSKEKREVEMALAVSKPLSEKDCKTIRDATTEQDNVEARAQFWAGLFSFPMIDNTHLSHSERCAVSVTDIPDQSIPELNNVTIAVSFFQASRASLKDKLYYDEILHDVFGSAKAEPKDR
jgi:hypothetical protein